MSLTVGVNSWVTVNEADTYLAEKRGADNWASLSNSIKEQDLISAFRWIYNSNKFNISKSSTTELVKSAQIELAWYLEREWECHQDREALQSQGVQEFELKDWREKYSGKADLPDFIYDILEDLVKTGAEGFTVTRPLSSNRGGGNG